MPIDEKRPFIPVNIAVLTVSDSRTLDDDKSGAKLAAMLTADGHRLASREIVKDDITAIVARLKAYIADPEIDVVALDSKTLELASNVRSADEPN